MRELLIALVLRALTQIHGLAELTQSTVCAEFYLHEFIIVRSKFYYNS